MRRNQEDYVDLVPPLNQGKARFEQTIRVSVEVPAAVQEFLYGLVSAFDIDKAVGVQLDAVGQRVGCSRQVAYPLQGIFFSMDDPLRGFDLGVWKGSYDDLSGVYTLDDDTYRRLMRAKVLANVSDGSVETTQAVLDAYFTDPETLVFVEDQGFTFSALFFTFDDPQRGFDTGYWKQAQDADYDKASSMAMTVAVAGKIPSKVDLALMDQGAFKIKPTGVAISYLVTTVDRTPLFGFDMDNDYVAGFDTGSFGAPPADVAQGLV